MTETKEFKFYDNCYYCDRDGNIYNKSHKLGRHVSPNWSGTNNPKSKLDEKEVQEIIKFYNSGLRIRDIKRTNKFNVSESRIGQIISSYKKTQTTTSVSGG